MTHKMTVRLSDEEKKKLQRMSNILTYSGVQSKGVRLAIEFLSQCLDRLNLKKHVNSWDRIDELNFKFKTKIDTTFCY